MQDPNRPSGETKRGFRFRFRGRKRVRYVAILPTLITLCNGVCGMLAIMLVASGLVGLRDGQGGLTAFNQAAYLILVAMVFDALDGRVARVTRTASSFGAQLDSFCDLITFGAAPAFLTYGLTLTRPQYWLPERVVMVVCVFYAMCALIRLARFTVETSPDEKSHNEFTGLPSPAAAGVVASGVVPWHAFPDWPFLNDLANFIPLALPIAIFVLGVLMVSRIRYIHVANRLFRGFRPFVTLVELALVLILVVLLYEFALFLAFVSYAATGPVLWTVNRLLRRPAAAAAPGTPTPDGAPPEEPLF